MCASRLQRAGRAAHWQPHARGLLSGLSLGSGAAEIARAALESIAFQVREQVVEALDLALDAPVDELRANGGATANEALMQLQADLLGRPLLCSAEPEISALGAAHMAGVGSGAWSLADLASHERPLERSSRGCPRASVRPPMRNGSRRCHWPPVRPALSLRRWTRGPMARNDELRLLAKVARLYYEDNLHPGAPSRRAWIFSQSSVSRLLKLRRGRGESSASSSRLRPGHLRRSRGSRSRMPRAEGGNRRRVDALRATSRCCAILGIGAAAYYVATTLQVGEMIGISSWSGTLLAMVNSDAATAPQRPRRSRVQVLGGVGSPTAKESCAAHLCRLAQLVGGSAHFLSAPGVAGSRGRHATSCSRTSTCVRPSTLP